MLQLLRDQVPQTLYRGFVPGPHWTGGLPSPNPLTFRIPFQYSESATDNIFSIVDRKPPRKSSVLLFHPFLHFQHTLYGQAQKYKNGIGLPVSHWVLKKRKTCHFIIKLNEMLNDLNSPVDLQGNLSCTQTFLSHWECYCCCSNSFLISGHTCTR